MEINKVVLHVVRESVRRHVSKLELNPDNFAFDSMVDHIGSDLVLTLTRRRATQDLGQVSFQVPATWFQHFKESHFPKFLLKKFPVKYTKLSVNASAFYDRISIPDETTEVKLFVQDGSKFLG